MPCILPELVIRDTCQNIAVLPLNPPIERILGIRLPSLRKASPASALLIAQLQKTVYEMEGPF
ncbi:hypothetical protein AAER45_05580, partial [Acinetobacter baumannii]|uniref:hypothetical protein n=1 Tax=Acinetobacter baumannii TaxID=470 RepID=UPI0031F39D89